MGLKILGIPITGSGGALGNLYSATVGQVVGPNSITGQAYDTVGKVAQQLGNTIESIVSDPKKLAAVGLMIAFPGAAGAVGDFILGDALAVDALVASGAMTASEAALIGGSTLGSGAAASAIVGQAAINAATNGGNVEQAVKAALIQQGLPAALKSDVMQSLNKDMVDVLGKYGAQATTQAGLAAIMGKDPVAAFVFSGATSAAGLITQQIPGFNNLPEAAQRALTSSVLAGLTGKDASTAAANSLVSSMVRGAQTAFAAAEKTGGKTILTGDQIKAVGESPVQPTSGALLDNTIKYAQLMNEGKVLNDPSTLSYVASLSPADYAQLEKYQMSRVPAPVVTAEVAPPTDKNSQEVAAGTQQLVDAITNAQNQTATDADTKVAGPGGITGGETATPDPLGLTNEQKAGVASYLSNAAGSNSGITKDQNGVYAVFDPSNARTLKFSSDGTYLGQTILVSQQEGQTNPVASDFLNALSGKLPANEKAEGVGADNQYTYSQGVGGQDTGAAGTGAGAGAGQGAETQGAESGAVDTSVAGVGGSNTGTDTGTDTGAGTGVGTGAGTGAESQGSGTSAQLTDDQIAQAAGFPSAEVFAMYGGDLQQYKADLVAQKNHQDIMDTFHSVLGRDPTPEEYAQFAGKNAIDVTQAITPPTKVVDSGGEGTSGGNGSSGVETVQTGGSGVTDGGTGTEAVSGYSGVSGIEPGGTGDVGRSGESGGVSGGESGAQSGTGAESGYSGYSGLSGEKGEAGDSGYSGYSGLSGDAGESGYSGYSGVTGASGYSGVSGTTGASGYSGVSGTTGASGHSGTAGRAGADASSSSFGSQFGSAGTGAVAGPTASELKPQFLTSKASPYRFTSPLAAVLALSRGMDTGENQAPQGENPMQTPHYSYGNVSSIDEILGMPDYFSALGGGSGSEVPMEAEVATGGLMSSPLMASAGGVAGTRYGKYAAGGLPGNVVHHSGKARVDFRHGDAVTGAGDGQSDDIPAMLADGEFVFPADVVAAIGNGSTKAGSDKLYDMMHGIRAHVRSAKPKDLPPEIKSPLDFLGKKHRKV